MACAPLLLFLHRATCQQFGGDRGFGTSLKWSLITPTSTLEKGEAAEGATPWFLSLAQFIHEGELWVGPNEGWTDTLFSAALLYRAAHATSMQLCNAHGSVPPCTGTRT